MNDKILKATHEGVLKIGDREIKCAVLEDGTRVITQRSVYGAMGRSGSTGGLKAKEGAQELPRIVAASNLSPFISDDLRCAINPILFKQKKGGNAYGYRAEILPEICNVYLKAHKANALSLAQQKIAVRCEILIKGFSRVGIIALVDEATGYQEERGKYELQQILKAYISEELLPWTTRFPMPFYKEMFRLWKWKFPPTNDKGAPRGPRYAGKLTKKLVYEQLPPGVTEELEKLNPPDEKWQRKHKHSQFLTNDIGNPHLEKQVAVVTTLMRISPNKRIFEKHFARAFPPAIPGPEKQNEFEFMKETEEE